MGGSSKDPNKAAMKMQEAQMDRLDNLSLPELEEYILQNPELVGLLDTEQLGSSALEEISLDPAAREAQLSALQSLQDYSETGVTDTDKYAMEQMLGQVGAATKSNQAAIEADMARKGMDSSGAALMSKMNAQQSGANDARQMAMQQAASGQQNRMAALNQLANQSGQMQQQDYARQANAASAKDAIAQANAANRYQTNATNLAARQAIENQRANTANQQAQMGNQIAQQNFNNQYSKTGAQGNVANAMSNIAGNAPQKPSAMQGAAAGAATGATIGGPWGALAGGVIGGVAASEDGGVISKYADGGIPHSNFKDGIDERKRLAKEKEDKQHDSFKSKYMKKVRNELMDEGDRRDIPSAKIHAEDGNLVQNQMPRNNNMVNFDKMGTDFNSLVQGKPTDNATVIGRGNDLTSDQVQTNEVAQDLIKEQTPSKGVDYAKALGALSSLMGEGGNQNKEKLKLGSNQVSAPENVMSPVGPQQFANPYSGMQFEDGGTPLYASDGMGDIIDSGEESYAGDRVDAKVNDGEMVINLPQQQRLMDILRGKISVDELGNDDIIEGVPREYRDELHEENSEESSGNMKGIEHLLKMLGEE